MNYFPGTANLLEEIDKKIMVVLRDGKTVIGFLRSVDQYANLVLHPTVERIHVGTDYGDVPLGNCLIRGENVVLLGEIDNEKDANLPLQRVSPEAILKAQNNQMEAKKEKERARNQFSREQGLTCTRHSDVTQNDY